MIVPNPNPGTLADVTAVATDDVWAAGSTTIHGKAGTLTEHWDGTSWRVVPSPNRGSYFSYLSAISAASAADVWAVGTYYSHWAESARTLGEHWDGSRWSIVPTPNGTPNIPLQAGNLFAVKAISADDAWAVGTHFDYMSSQHGLTAHWDGTQWTSVRSDRVERDSDLFGVDALPGNRAWAVGDSFDKYSGEGTNDLIYQLGANGWTQDAPPEGLDIEQLYDVAVVGPTDVWAVGFDIDEQSPTLHTLVEHCSSPA